MRIVRSTLVNEYDSSRLGQAQKRQRCHACVSVTVKHIMYAKNAYVVTFFSCFLNVMTSLDFVTFFLKCTSHCAYEQLLNEKSDAFCVSGDTFGISNLYRIQMDNFYKLLIKNSKLNMVARFVLFYASCKNQTRDSRKLLVLRVA